MFLRSSFVRYYGESFVYVVIPFLLLAAFLETLPLLFGTENIVFLGMWFITLIISITITITLIVNYRKMREEIEDPINM